MKLKDFVLQFGDITDEDNELEVVVRCDLESRTAGQASFDIVDVEYEYNEKKVIINVVEKDD